MAGATPRYGIRYPEISDLVIAESIEQTMEDIDAALTAVRGRVEGYLTRPFAMLNMLGFQTVPSGTQTALVLTDVIDPLDMHVAGTDVTIPEDGLWYANCDNVNLSLFGGQSATSTAYRITRNGVTEYAKSSFGLGVFVAPTSLGGLMACEAGDVIRVTALWTGTGSSIHQMNGGTLAVVKIGEL